MAFCSRLQGATDSHLHMMCQQHILMYYKRFTSAALPASDRQQIVFFWFFFPGWPPTFFVLLHLHIGSKPCFFHSSLAKALSLSPIIPTTAKENQPYSMTDQNIFNVRKLIVTAKTKWAIFYSLGEHVNHHRGGSLHQAMALMNLSCRMGTLVLENILKKHTIDVICIVQMAWTNI